MIYTDTNSTFPDQVVSDEIKSSYEYGLQVGRAVEGECGSLGDAVSAEWSSQEGGLC